MSVRLCQMPFMRLCARLPAASIPLGALLLALMVYALWGTPTPDRMAMPEYMIGGLLLVAAGTAGIWQAVTWQPRAPLWAQAGRVLLWYGFTSGICVGMLAGNDPALIARDALSFMFLLMPVFFYGQTARFPVFRNLLTGTVMVAGWVIAVRVVAPFFSGYSPVKWDPDYLANGPVVLASTLCLLGYALLGLYRSATVLSFAKSALMLVMAFVPLMAMALIVQRAFLGAVVLALLFWMVVGLWRAPVRVLAPLFLGAVGLWLLVPYLGDIAQALFHKTAMVGFNNRDNEAMAVLDEIDGRLIDSLFGKGWGATYASPAVGEVTVNYTHSLLTTYLLKTGLFGAGLAVCYLGGLLWKLGGMLPRRPVITLALAAPFLVTSLLYASFKSLDFGLLLLLIVVWSNPHAAVASGRQFQ